MTAADGALVGQAMPAVSFSGMLTYEDLQAQLDAERSWWSTSIQTIQMQQVQALEDMINEKVGKSVEMTCALSASCDERFSQLGAQAAERAADFNSLRLEAFAGPGVARPPSGEVISELNALQSDIEAMWIQHRAALGGISSTKEQQHRLEVSFGELRKDLEGALTDVRAQHSSFSGLAAETQVVCNASPQQLDAVRKEHREEFVREITMLRQELEVLASYGDCLQRLQEKTEHVQELHERQEEVHRRLEVMRSEQREELAHEILAVRREIEAKHASSPDRQLASEVSALRQELGVRQQAASVAPVAVQPGTRADGVSAEKFQQLEADVKGARADLEAEVLQRCMNVSDLHARVAREIADMGRRVETHWGEISHSLERRAHV